MISIVVWPVCKTISPSCAEKISDLGKLAGLSRLNKFERVQILVEMELICTYHSSLHQDEIMAEIWKQQSGFYSENCTKQ